MTNQNNIINQYKKNISEHINDNGCYPYFVTTTFNMKNHDPDDVEGDLLNRIKHTKTHDPFSPILSILYKELSDHRFKVNGFINRSIYEKTVTHQRLNWIWNQYDIFQTHLVKSMINNAARSSKIDLFPVTFDYVDVVGSKHGNYLWFEDSAIHLHSIYLIKPEICGKFEWLVDNQFWPILWHPKLNGIRSVHAEKIGSEADDLSNVIEYAAKCVLTINPLKVGHDLPLTNQYPITAQERLMKRQHAQSVAAAA